MKSISHKIIEKDVRAAARFMRRIESGDITAAGELKKLQQHQGRAHIIGITGLPGSGKSTIIDALIEDYIKDKRSIGVIAVDPSSPFSGGSLMGDRIRMKNFNLTDGVFIKSLPTRGWHGGISKVTSRMITVMNAMGKDIIMVETAGVGQAEVDIKNLVHTTIVVLVGGLGDHIQVMKAGIIEIADIFVINKSKSNDNSKDLGMDLKRLLDLTKNEERHWLPPILFAEAISKIGIKELITGINNHRKFLIDNRKYEKFYHDKKNRDQKQMVEDYILEAVRKKLKDNNEYNNIFEKISSINNDNNIGKNILNDFFK